MNKICVMLCVSLLLLLTACGKADASAGSSVQQSEAAAASSSQENPSDAAQKSSDPSAASPDKAQSETNAPSIPSEPPAKSGESAHSDPQPEESSSSPMQEEPAVEQEPITVTFTQGTDNVTLEFSRLPVSAAEVEEMDSIYYQTPEYAVGMFIAILCHYPDDAEETLRMLEVINGPETITDYDKSFLKDRMEDRNYKPFSFLEGSSPDNDYTPTKPYKLTVYTASNTYDEDGYARLMMQSSGADSKRPIMVRKKESTGEWFFWDHGLLPDIRTPVSQDPWA